MAINVLFKHGQSTNLPVTREAKTFYYTDDTKQLYIGDTLLSNAGDVTAAVARIAQNESDISALQTLVTTLNGDSTVNGSVRKLIADAVATLTASLADVATSGAAEDVSIEDTAGKFTATDVEGALAEIATTIENLGGTVTLTVADTATAGYLKTYELYQDDTLVGKIDIPKDLVVQSGSVVEASSENPIVIGGTTYTSGTFIRLVIANQTDPIYINAADLVDVYTAAQGATEVQLAVTGTEISATIVAMNGSKLIDGSVAETKLDSTVVAKLAKANTALQASDITEGATNGTISVGGTDVAVHGLGSAAYADTTDFDASGSADAVLGTSSDTSTDNTVYGVKALATAANTAASAAQTDVDNLETLVGTLPQDTEATTVVGYVTETKVAMDGRLDDLEEAVGNGGSIDTRISNAIGALDVTDTEVTGQYVSAVNETDGEISVTRRSLPDYSNTYDAKGSAAQALADAEAYTDAALTWGSF